MLIGFLATVFSIICIFMILLILIQKGKSSLGIGNLGGGSQALFGSSGGQDIFQKITWILGAILIIGSFGLSILKTKDFASKTANAPMAQERRIPTQIPEE